MENFDVCVLHNCWESEEEGLRTCGYVLQERREQNKEFLIRCYFEGEAGRKAQTSLYPVAAEDYEKAAALLYHLAREKVSPIHIEDILADLGQ